MRARARPSSTTAATIRSRLTRSSASFSRCCATVDRLLSMRL
jgi:hypothetical protein